MIFSHFYLYTIAAEVVQWYDRRKRKSLLLNEKKKILLVATQGAWNANVIKAEVEVSAGEKQIAGVHLSS